MPPPLRSPPTQVGPAIVPALIARVLRDGVEHPLHLAGLRVDREDVPAGYVALAARAADVDHAVVHLRRAGEPVAHADRRGDLRIAFLQHVEDDVRLAVGAEGRDRLAGFRVEREQERSSRRVDHAVGIDRPALAEDVAFARAAADLLGHVERPQQMAVDRVDGVDAAARIGDVCRAVDDDRRRLIADAVDDPVLEQPARRQRLHVARVDLVERRVAGAGQIQVVQNPVDVALPLRVEGGHRQKEGAADHRCREDSRRHDRLLSRRVGRTSSGPPQRRA